MTLRTVEKDIEVAPGARQRMWTFGGTAPGPVLRGRVGDTFEITLVNDGSIGHSVDFHAGALAPDKPMRTIEPGERLVYRFRAERAGAWLYHCGTAPMLQHIGNGMYGAVVIDPPDLPEVDREYLLVASQLYLGAPGSEEQVAGMRANRPDAWAFNGAAAQYGKEPLTARAASGSASGWSRPDRATGSPSTWWAPSSTPSTRRAATCCARTTPEAPRCSIWLPPRAVSSRPASPRRGPTPSSTTTSGAPRPAPTARCG
ncbi:multicopper oxidase domain-containing protein [Streptomyces radiopugnans]|nr:multicopper oxidase domain-containing protein [Streptomyces radiopugnans]